MKQKPVARVAAALLGGLLTPTFLHAQTAAAPVISTYAGSADYVSVPALSVGVGTPYAVVLGPTGSVYYSTGVTSEGGAVYRLDPASGKVSIVAGSNTAGYSGDGGPATRATLVAAYGVAIDAAGDVYVADSGNDRIRRIDAVSGLITTVAGGGTNPGNDVVGDGGPAIGAQLSNPNAVVLDGAGNLLIADQGNSRVRRVDAVTGTITTVAGNGSLNGPLGDGGPATAATVGEPTGLALDAAGNVYVSDLNTQLVRRVDAATGIITTIAGGGSNPGNDGVGDGGAATGAALRDPVGLTLDSAGNLYIADGYGSLVRRVDATTGIITAAASNTGFINGVALDANGNLYAAIADANTPSIVRYAATGPTSGNVSSGIYTLTNSSVVAGNGTYAYGGDGFSAMTASLYAPHGVATDASGNLFLADYNNFVVRRVDAKTGVIATVAGNGNGTYDGVTQGAPATSVPLGYPGGVTVDPSGNVYISDIGDGAIYRVDATSGTIRVLTNLTGINGGVAELYAVALDPAGNLYVTDTLNNVVDRVDVVTGVVTLVAGTAGQSGDGGDNGPATGATLGYPESLATDSAGNLYIGDDLNYVVRRVDAKTGVITTVAGTGSYGPSADGNLATASALEGAAGLAVDANGNLFISEPYRIRRVDAVTGILTTVAGDGSYGFGGDGGPALNASLGDAEGLAFDPSGNLYVADTQNNRIRKIAGIPDTIAYPQPTVAPTVTGPQGINGWYTGNVNVSWTVTGQSISAQTGCTSSVISTDTTGLTLTCSATNPAGTASQSVTIRRDATAPLATATAAPLANANGWNDTAVTVSFSGSDSTSGIAGCTANVVLAAQGAGQSATGTCTDNAGNTSQPAVISGIDIELTGPVVSDTVSPPPNASGWSNVPVTVAFTGVDPLSGVAPNGCTGPITVSTNGSGESVMGSCIDLAGNTTTVVVSGINVDTTPPVAVASPVPPPNANGWNNTPVTVTFSGTDSIPGSGVASCTSPITFSMGNARPQVATGTCVDVAGNMSTPVGDSVNLDLQPPVIAMGNPSNGAGFPVGASVNAVYNCTDSQSGVAPGSCTGNVPNGGALDTSSAGTRSFSVTATDLAGNTTTSNTHYLISTLTLTTPGSIWTYAGDGIQGISGDTGLAVNASLSNPRGLAMDSAGNLYVADQSASVRKIAANGTVTSIAIPNLVQPVGAAVDSSGNVYIADYSRNEVYRIAADGTVSIVAGTGTPGFSGDGGPAISASLTSPYGLAVDSNGNLYIADYGNQRIRRVSVDGTITTVAGSGTLGFSGDGGPATAASLSYPAGVAVDGSGNLYIVDQLNRRIREVTPAGVISTVAGGGSGGLGDGGPATSATFNAPLGIAVDSGGNLFVADLNNFRVREVSAGGIISTVAGVGTFGFSGDGGLAVNAQLNAPMAVAVDSAGNLYVADSFAGRIRLVPGIAAASDTKPPAITPSISGTLGTNGWYTSNVAVSWTVTDPLAPVISTTGCSTTTISSDTTGQVVTCSAVGQGGTATQSVTIKRDATPPVASATPSPVPNGDGWNNSTVTVAFVGTDSTSGIASCTPSLTLSTQGANQTSSTGTCTDNAGNVSTAVAATGISIDETPPVVSGRAAPSPNSNGWNNTAVTVTFTATDSLSGVAPTGCQAPIVVTANGSAQSVQGSCSDKAGNSATATVSGINVDTIAPVATATASPAANAAGWNNGPVTVSFSGTDTLSGSGIASCSPSVVVSKSGAGQVVSGSCTDRAGNVSAGATKTVNVDQTVPVVTITTPVNGASYGAGSTVDAAYSCADAVSGVTSCVGTVADGAAIDTSAVGPHGFTVTGTSVAGTSTTQSLSYSVVAAAPSYSLAPNPLAFGNQALRSSTTLVITLTSTGSVALPVTSVSVTGPNRNEFTESNTCGTSVPAGTACSVSVVFTPTSIGLKTATVTVGAGGGAGTKTVSLSGTGADAAFSIAPGSFVFPETGVAVKSMPSTFTIASTGVVALPLDSITLAGANPGQFLIVSQDCPGSLAPGSRCSVNVAFEPKSSGTKNATLRVVAGGGAGSMTVPLSGTGVAPTYSMTPTSLSFGNQLHGSSSPPQTVTLENTGLGPLPVQRIAVTGPFIETNTCGIVVTPRSSCTIAVVFDPTSKGAKTGTLTVTAGDGAARRTISLKGAGT